ncbi:suppressor of fused domain protein [Paenibacillus sambharensis]|uniref:Suppressor of fused domain protein n=1 Tax=Paenibacillus sambharensis TaxID=1803190 RepID=A0A2W1LUW7_9BACL|nr:suppressor of fused domain protein [Paenibacillus sambharensis]PZD95297.1 suppressor of fused domain protein [Paenibacillus sambharensis]
MSEEYSKAGDQIYRYNAKEPEWRPPTYGEDGWMEAIVKHVERYYGETDTVYHEIISDLIHVDVHHISPTNRHPYHVLFTTGMSYLPMAVPEGREDYRFAELMICLPPEWPVSDEAFKDPNHYWPVYWLKMLARLPHEHGTWLGAGHTIPNGDPAEPLADNTRMSGIILLPPVRTETDFLTLSMADGRLVHFYCLVPLYAEEMDLKLAKGANALTDKFDKYQVNEWIDPARKNTCKRSFFSKWKG